jgi:hypothetical protein
MFVYLEDHNRGDEDGSVPFELVSESACL